LIDNAKGVHNLYKIIVVVVGRFQRAARKAVSENMRGAMWIEVPLLADVIPEVEVRSVLLQQSVLRCLFGYPCAK